jgi:hypothetical protein
LRRSKERKRFSTGISNGKPAISVSDGFLKNRRREALQIVASGRKLVQEKSQIILSSFGIRHGELSSGNFGAFLGFLWFTPSESGKESSDERKNGNYHANDKRDASPCPQQATGLLCRLCPNAKGRIQATMRTCDGLASPLPLKSNMPAAMLATAFCFSLHGARRLALNINVNGSVLDIHTSE